MNNLIKEIIAPQFSLETYKKLFIICDKFIQIGIFVIVMIQLIFSYFDYKDGNILVVYCYTSLLGFSIFYILGFVRTCRSNLQKDFSSAIFREEDNQYIFEILTRITENTRNIYIVFIIAMYSERIIDLNVWVVAIVFAIVSIPTVINIKSKKIASIAVFSIIIFNLYTIICFYKYVPFYVLIIVFITLILFFNNLILGLRNNKITENN